MKFPELDEVCNDIFSFFTSRLIIGNEPIRFNELLRELESMGIEWSRPTISKHLKHLVENELIIREEVDKQNVTYRFYNERWKGTYENLENRNDIIEKIMKAKEAFLNESLENQIYIMVNSITLTSLEKIKYNLLSIIDPDNSFMYNVSANFYENRHDIFLNYFLQSFILLDNNKQKNIINIIEEMKKDYFEQYF